jgi:hypothetical protein
MSAQNQQTQQASIAALTELHEKLGNPTGDYSVLIGGPSDAGEQLLMPCTGQAAYHRRSDGGIGFIAASGDRGASADGGRTWQLLDRITFPDPPANVQGDKGGGFGGYTGPAGIVNMKNGKLGMTWTQSYGIGGNHQLLDHYFRTSDDNGDTWSDDVLVNLGHDKGAPFFGTLRQLDSGRLIQPVRWLLWGGDHNVNHSTSEVNGEIVAHEGHLHHPEFESAYCYFSDDNGATWSRSKGDILGYLQDGWGNYVSMDEPTLDQLPDGRVLLIARSSLGRLMRSISEDGGETWSIPEPTDLMSDGAPCASVRLPGSNDVLIVWNQSSASEIRRGLRRCRLCSAITRDGVKFDHFRTIEWHSYVPKCDEHINPEPWLQMLRASDHVGPLPDNYGNSCYPAISVNGDEVLVNYLHILPRHPGGGIGALKLRIMSVGWFSE